MSDSRPSFARPQWERPWVTWTAIAICCAVFLGLNRERDSAEAFSKWGAPSAMEIWSGAYWGLITSALVHKELWHLAFNLYWWNALGTRIEATFGPLRYLVLLLLAAAVSSAGQLATGTTGHGASGVCYALFGFMLVLRNRYPDFQRVLSKQTIQLFIVWLFGCMAATFANIVQIGNVAHVMGLLFGMAAAGGFVLPDRRRLFVPAACALVIGSLVPVVWCPWLLTWRLNHAHIAGNTAKEIEYYGELIESDSHPAWAYYNRGCCYRQLKQLDNALKDFQKAGSLDSDYETVESLGFQASEAFKAGNYDESISLYSQAIAKDPDAAFAYYNRGCAYGAIGDRQKALANFGAAAKLDRKYAVFNNDALKKKR